MNEQLDMADVWKPEVKEYSVSEVDAKIKELARLRADYEAKKKTSGEAHKLYKEQESEVLSMLDDIGKTSFKTDGVGTVTKKVSFGVTTPKTPDDKELLFKWLKDNLGKDGFMTYASVNSQSLNALYNEMYSEAEDKENFKIDGVGDPIDRITLSFRKG